MNPDLVAASVSAVAGVFGVAVVIGIAVLVTAEEALVAVARAAAKDVSRTFWLGVLWQLLALPLLGSLVVGLAITILGILAIPLAVLAWTLAYVGALTLGLLGVALLIGRALSGRGSGTSSRAIELRSLLIGLVTIATVWFVAVSVGPVPVLGLIARLMALAFTWVITTVGLGAVVETRAGLVGRHAAQITNAFATRTRAVFTPTDAPTVRREPVVPSWQTPTPVTGVVAARRPVVASPTDGEAPTG